MSKPIIEIENIGKRYRIGGKKEQYLSLRDEMVNWLSPAKRRERAAKEEFWALKDVSFSVAQGEAVGIIGRNGAGKSTLLKVLSQITPPTEGKITMYGRVASLLEVGTGFHPELSGRENIYLNGAILGMTRSEIARKFDEIVDFAEVEQFLDTPVKRYSSGMYVRLAFAVAAHLEPEILVVDEVLAVGDASFQKKCLGKMGDVAHSGRTVLFVSHNMAAVKQLCQNGVVLSNGSIVFAGNIEKSVEYYQDAFSSNVSGVAIADRNDRSGDGSIRTVDVRVGTGSSPQCGYWTNGKDATVEIDYICREGTAHNNVEVCIGLSRLDGSRLLYLGSKVVKCSFGVISHKGTFTCTVPDVPLEPGHYSINVEIQSNYVIVDLLKDAFALSVNDGDFYNTGVWWPYSSFLCRYDWSHCDK